MKLLDSVTTLKAAEGYPAGTLGTIVDVLDSGVFLVEVVETEAHAGEEMASVVLHSSDLRLR